MLIVEIPSELEAERKYAVQVIVGEFLGFEFRLMQGTAGRVRLARNNRRIDIADVFFESAKNAWLSEASLPQLPLLSWNPAAQLPDALLAEPTLPVLFGRKDKSGAYADLSANRAWLGLDVFGATFFLLTRYEEAVRSERDAHDRFPGHASVAYRADFLHRPIVNEYLEILWAVLRRTWPDLPPRRQRSFRILPSHDVDNPYFYAFVDNLRAFRRFAGDIAGRGMSPARAIRRLADLRRVRGGHLGEDPYATFDMIMGRSDAIGLRSAFFFICGHTGGTIDGDYEFDHPYLRALIRKIHERGHEIGIHPSYHTYMDVSAMFRELTLFQRVCEEEKVDQPAYGGRQHFLRWRTPDTFRNLDQAGLSYDSTLTFADRAGFRCGTCYEYDTFDIVNHKKLNLRERPLIVMECSVTDARYMDRGVGEQAADEILRLKNSCHLFRGDFTLLWHNSRLVNQKEVDLYRQVLCS